jgi:hypothetical protein
MRCNCEEPFPLEDIDRRLEAGEGAEVEWLGMTSDEDEYALRPANPVLVFRTSPTSAGAAQHWVVTLRTAVSNLTINYRQGWLGTVFQLFQGDLFTNIAVILLISLSIVLLVIFLRHYYAGEGETGHPHNE